MVPDRDGFRSGAPRVASRLPWSADQAYVARPRNALRSSCTMRWASFCEVVTPSSTGPLRATETTLRWGWVNRALEETFRIRFRMASSFAAAYAPE